MIRPSFNDSPCASVDQNTGSRADRNYPLLFEMLRRRTNAMLETLPRCARQNTSNITTPHALQHPVGNSVATLPLSLHFAFSLSRPLLLENFVLCLAYLAQPESWFPLCLFYQTMAT
jgi:hypothetical protein